jgi:hypothetical protein
MSTPVTPEAPGGAAGRLRRRPLEGGESAPGDASEAPCTAEPSAAGSVTSLWPALDAGGPGCPSRVRAMVVQMTSCGLNEARETSLVATKLSGPSGESIHTAAGRASDVATRNAAARSVSTTSLSETGTAMSASAVRMVSTRPPLRDGPGGDTELAWPGAPCGPAAPRGGAGCRPPGACPLEAWPGCRGASPPAERCEAKRCTSAVLFACSLASSPPEGPTVGARPPEAEDGAPTAVLAVGPDAASALDGPEHAVTGDGVGEDSTSRTDGEGARAVRPTAADRRTQPALRRITGLAAAAGPWGARLLATEGRGRERERVAEREGDPAAVLDLEAKRRRRGVHGEAAMRGAGARPKTSTSCASVR